MRVVCSFIGGAGHLLPQVPLHRALAAAGHTLDLVGRESGVAAAPRGLYRELVSRPDRRARTGTTTIGPLEPVGRERELEVVGRHFAGTAADTSAGAVAPLLRGADLVVCDELDFGALAVARREGVPSVSVAVIASGALVRADLLVEPLAALGERLGLSGPAPVRGDHLVVPFHPAVRDPAFPDPADSLSMRPDVGPPPSPDGSVVATLGTEFNTECGDLFERILLALATLGVPATLAIGRELDPARFEAPPAHVRIVSHADLRTLVPAASVVVHHGGSGTFSQAVTGGTPQLVLPMGADQPFTADQVTRLGLGRVLDPLTATPAAIAAAVRELAAGSVTRARVARLREQTLALPDPTAVVARLGATR